MTPEQSTRLRAPFPPEQVGHLPRKNKQTGQVAMLDYVGHAEVTARLLEVDPEWNWEPMAKDDRGLPAFIVDAQGYPVGLWIRLTVAGVERIGFGSVAGGGFDPEKQLISDAIRNAAMRFGVALQQWAKSDLSHEDTALDRGDTPGGLVQAVLDQRATHGAALAETEAAFRSQFERANDRLAKAGLNPGQVSPLLLRDVGKGQFNEANVDAWCAKTGRSPEELIAQARDVARHQPAAMHR